jgi:dynein heavy chain
LSVASPATVSRCGMVYMEPVSLGMQPLIDSWMKILFPNLVKKIKPKLLHLFSTYVAEIQKFIRLEVNEIQSTQDNNLVSSFMKLLDCFLENYKETETKKISNDDIELLDGSIESIFLFCLTWSFGCTGDYASRLKFDKKLRSLNGRFPEQGLIYDY